jgi:damage-control phosphatase, subfamily I
MRFSLECLPCYMRQTLESGKFITQDEAVHEKLMREALVILAKFNVNESDFETHRNLYKLIKSYCPNGDPFLLFKKEFNDICLELEEYLNDLIIKSGDPFESAVRISLAGNLIDSGIGTNLTREKLIQTIDDSLRQKINKENIDDLRKNILRAKKILFIGDNTGEIVFDKIFIQNCIPTDKVTYVVRGGPAMNDSTMEDARYVGIDKVVKVITTGIDLPAAAISLASEEFKKEYYSSDLIISKGMGNFEALMDEDNNIFFLLKIKCEVILKCFKGKYNLGDIIIDTFNHKI